MRGSRVNSWDGEGWTTNGKMMLEPHRTEKSLGPTAVQEIVENLCYLAASIWHYRSHIMSWLLFSSTVIIILTIRSRIDYVPWSWGELWIFASFCTHALSFLLLFVRFRAGNSIQMNWEFWLRSMIGFLQREGGKWNRLFEWSVDLWKYQHLLVKSKVTKRFQKQSVMVLQIHRSTHIAHSLNIKCRIL